MRRAMIGKRVFLTKASGSDFGGRYLYVNNVYPRHGGVSVDLRDENEICVIGMNLDYIKKCSLHDMEVA